MTNKYLKLIKELEKLNRHHISPDMDLTNEKLKEFYKGNIEKYDDDPSLTWRIPPGYKVIRAELKDSKGNLICSHKDNPMHLWSYSPSFKGKVKYSDLKKKILFDPQRPYAIVFHFRNQYRFWKREWGFSLNIQQYQKLKKNESYLVDIKTEFYQDSLKQFLLKKPSNKNNVILVSHIDHYCQVNDGLASSVLNNEVVEDLSEKLNNINICSLNSIEIIGSVYFLKKYKLNFSNTIAAISTNGLSLESDLIFQKSGKMGSIINKVINLTHLIYYPKNKMTEFREIWGKDEIAYEVPGIQIPCISLLREPNDIYHTHLDDLSAFSNKSFLESKDVLKKIIISLDQNYIVKVKNWDHLICLSNPDLNLYIEPTHISGIKTKTNIDQIKLFENLSICEKKYLKKNINNVLKFVNTLQSYLANNNEVTIIDIAYNYLLPISFVKFYFDLLEEKGFVSLKFKNS